MSVARISPTVTGRRRNSEIERFRLKSSAVAARASRVRAVTTKQDTDMHFVGFALQPPEKTAHSVPPVVLVIVIGVFARSLFAVDYKGLIGLG